MPIVNFALISINVTIFLLTMDRQGQMVYSRFGQFMLWPDTPQLTSFLTYQFLHADIWHLLFNMVFMYVFGNSVEDRLGRAGYLFFYLAGGVIAGLGHSLMEHNPVLGASGSIAAVTGAYLALFPLSNVTIFYWFIFIVDTFVVSSLVLILFRVASDLLFQIAGGEDVAYLAHLAGYAFGFVVGMAMLLTRLLEREPYDLLALIEQRKRREQFRRMTRKGFQPWTSSKDASNTPLARESAADSPTPKEERLMVKRAAISSALASDHQAEAAKLYVELLEEYPDQTMGQQQQLDLANQLMSEGRYGKAAAAYELFLSAYKTYPERQQIELILGLVYARYLDQKNRAKELLTSAEPRLDGDELELAKSVLAELG